MAVAKKEWNGFKYAENPLPESAGSNPYGSELLALDVTNCRQ